MLLAFKCSISSTFHRALVHFLENSCSSFLWPLVGSIELWACQFAPFAYSAERASFVVFSLTIMNTGNATQVVLDKVALLEACVPQMGDSALSPHMASAAAAMIQSTCPTI